VVERTDVGQKQGTMKADTGHMAGEEAVAMVYAVVTFEVQGVRQMVDLGKDGLRRFKPVFRHNQWSNPKPGTVRIKLTLRMIRGPVFLLSLRVRKALLSRSHPFRAMAGSANMITTNNPARKSLNSLFSLLRNSCKSQ